MFIGTIDNNIFLPNYGKKIYFKWKGLDVNNVKIVRLEHSKYTWLLCNIVSYKDDTIYLDIISENYQFSGFYDNWTFHIVYNNEKTEPRKILTKEEFIQKMKEKKEIENNLTIKNAKTKKPGRILAMSRWMGF